MEYPIYRLFLMSKDFVDGREPITLWFSGLLIFEP